jgi:hypothetical protein
VDVDGLPWRPMTVSEVLDAAVDVLRARPVQLLAIALLLASLEQLVLYPLRTSLVGGQHNYRYDLIGLHHQVWTVLAAGMGTEAFAIGVLGAFAAVAARCQLLASVPQTSPAPRARLTGAIVLSFVIGVVAAVTFWAGGILWVCCFMLTGLVMPTLVNDVLLGSRGPGRPTARLSVFGAFRRGVVLVIRAGLRPGGIRLMSHAILSMLRLLIAWVGVQVLPEFIPIPIAAEYAIWIVVNATMYACIASGDAASHLETRIRVEGLDLEMNRSIRLGTPIAEALAVPR